MVKLTPIGSGSSRVDTIMLPHIAAALAKASPLNPRDLPQRLLKSASELALLVHTVGSARHGTIMRMDPRAIIPKLNHI